MGYTTQVNYYSGFGGPCYWGFIDGLFARDLNTAPSFSHWHIGSDKTTQVNYCRLGDECINGFLAGLSAVNQNQSTSLSGWTTGSNIDKRTMLDSAEIVMEDQYLAIFLLLMI